MSALTYIPKLPCVTSKKHFKNLVHALRYVDLLCIYSRLFYHFYFRIIPTIKFTKMAKRTWSLGTLWKHIHTSTLPMMFMRKGPWSTCQQGILRVSMVLSRSFSRTVFVVQMPKDRYVASDSTDGYADCSHTLDWQYWPPILLCCVHPRAC